MPLQEDDPAAWVKAHVADYVAHPSREYYFKVKSPYAVLQRQRRAKRSYAHISTDASTVVSDPATAVTAAEASKTLYLYHNEIVSTCVESARAQDVFKRTAALECRHLHLSAADVFECPRGNNAPLRSELTLAAFMFSPSMPWSGACGLGANLVVLDLEQNALSDDGIEHLCAEVLPRTKNLERLLLASNGIHQRGLALLCAFLLRPSPGGGEALPHLATLGLTNNDLGSEKEDAAALPPSFSLGGLLAEVLLLYRRTARRLHLNHVGFKTEDLVKLLTSLFSKDAAATALDAFPCFETIYLKQNDAIDSKAVEDSLSSLALSEAHRYFLKKHVLL